MLINKLCRYVYIKKIVTQSITISHYCNVYTPSAAYNPFTWDIKRVAHIYQHCIRSGIRNAFTNATSGICLQTRPKYFRQSPFVHFYATSTALNVIQTPEFIMFRNNSTMKRASLFTPNNWVLPAFRNAFKLI